MNKIVIRNSEGDILATVTKVLSCAVDERLEGERTLTFSTLLEGGLETMQDEGNYTADFENELYDVASFKKTMSGNLCMIDLSCEHISYRLNEYKKDEFTMTGKPEVILAGLLDGTGFTVGGGMPQQVTTHSIQQSATVRAIILDFAKSLGYDAVFSRMSVTLVSHRGKVADTKIIDNNVLEISKTVNLTDETTAYTLQMRPHSDVGVGDEVHLVFRRLGIDDHVRVLGIKREPFVTENITLEVGAYIPDLAAESVHVVTNMLSKNEVYYGARISADNGIEINRADGKAGVVFNADKMEFTQDGDQVLFFDPVARKWKLSAEAEIHVTDPDGMDTTVSALAEGLTTRIEDADEHYIEIKQTIDGLTVTTEQGETLIDGGMIVTDNLRLHRLIAKESPNSFIEMMSNGLNFVLGNANTIGIGYASADIPLPYMIFGEGASPQSDQSGMIKFYQGGLWLGDSADRHSEAIQSGTGLFVDVPNDKVYIYINGEGTEVADMANLQELVLRELEKFKPIAVFG